MARWSRQQSVRTGLVVIGLLAVFSGIAGLFASRALVRDLETRTLSEAQDLADSKVLRLFGLRELSNASTALLTRDEQLVLEARANAATVRDRVARLQARLPEFEKRSLLDQVMTAQREYDEAFDEAARAVRRGPDAPELADLKARAIALEQSLDSLVAGLSPASVGGLAEIRSSAKWAQWVFTGLTLVSIALAVFLCAMLILVLNRSAREQSVARVVAEEGRTRITADLNAARAANQLKDQFLATVSHELRNPLAPILTWTQLLRSGTLEKHKVERGLEVIERNVLSLSELIDDLVDVSRVVSGKFRLDVRPIELVSVIRAAAESQRPAIDAKHIRLKLVLDERTGVVSGDSERLQQVMANLLSNAIKFTPKGGSVQVILRRANSHVEVVVADTGIGIDSKFLPHVFEPFQQEQDGSMRRHSGLGLGLSIVHHIIELHGGVVLAASPGTDQGATFTIQLPLLGIMDPVETLRPRHPRVADGLSNVLLGRLDRIRVLLVDDEPNANEAVQILLESCGAEVRSAGSASQALQMLDHWKPDVLISDIAMPEEDGYVLIRRIRQRAVQESGDLPAAALTAYATTEDRVSILAAGFQMHLSKPAEPSELIAVVASLAARRRRSRTDTPEPDGHAGPLPDGTP